MNFTYVIQTHQNTTIFFYFQPAGATFGDTAMTLTVVGTNPTTLYPGQTVSFELRAHLPTISTHTD